VCRRQEAAPVWKPKVRSYDAILALLGVAALVDMALPALTVVALISIIGIPIAVLLMALPTVALVLIVARLLQKTAKREGKLAAVLSIAATLLLLAGVAAYCNGQLNERAEALVAGDVDTLSPLRLDTLGLVDGQSRWGHDKQTACGDLCLRLLLNGAAKRVVVFPYPETPETLMPEAAGRAFWLEQRPACPTPVFQDSHEMLSGEDHNAPTAAAIMALKLATGTCLAEGVATLNGVETLAAVGDVAKGASDCAAGFAATADTVRGYRLAVYQAGPQGLTETYRRTSVLWMRHPWIVSPSIVGCYGLEMRAAFFRVTDRLNADARYFEAPQLSNLLAGKLGLPLALTANTADAASIISRALDTSGPLPEPLHRVIEDYFEALRPPPPSSAEAKALALRILDDPRVPPPRATYALTMAMAKDVVEANARLADSLFRKIAATPPQAKEDHPTYLGWLVQYVDNAISVLPDDAVKPHRADIEALVRDPDKRFRAPATLRKLALFGADAVPELMSLIEESLALRPAETDHATEDRWREPMRAGLAALCRIGPDANSAVPRLVALSQDGTRKFGMSDLAFAEVLLSIGADEETARRAAGGFTSETDQNNFRIIAKRVGRGKADCV
jgi:hypothetical protein